MDKNIKLHPLHTKGRYYVDSESCTCMGACELNAPNNFRLGSEHSAYVFKQPETPEEEAQCQEAIIICSHEAIHDDGENL